MTLLPIESREYKVMLDHRAFDDRDAAVSEFWNEVTALAESIGITHSEKLKEKKSRFITFLDTPDLTLFANGLVLRRRAKSNASETEYTLKCRSDDRYIAAAADLRAAEGFVSDLKFEEDIAAPFRCRYSRSSSIELEGEHAAPVTLGQSALLFPTLSQLRRDSLPCPSETPLAVVNNVRALERVHDGPELRLGDEKADVAVILWSNDADGRCLVAEFSFRYKDKGEKYSATTAGAARKLFLLIQRLDWCRPDGMTKTEYVYRSTAAR